MAIAIGLVKMLLELQESRKAGVLDVSGRGARVRLFVEEGRVVQADEGGQDQKQGHATPEARVSSAAMRALGWDNARFRFIESAGPLVLADRFVTPPEPLIIGALRLADREDIDGLLAQSRDRYAALHGEGGTSAHLDAFRFPPKDEAFARRLDAGHTVQDLVDAKDGEGVDRPVILAALLLTDRLDLRATASAPGGLEPPSAVQVGPETPVAETAPLLAEQAYQSGKRLVRANRLGEAVVALRRAAQLYPAVEYDLWVAWTEARADTRNEDAHAEALRAVAERAIEEDAERGFATFVLGHLARRQGDNGAAEALFEQARALDPTAIEDAWEVRLRLGPAARARTRGEVRALAPLLTTPSAPPVAPDDEQEERVIATLRGIAPAEPEADAPDENPHEENAHEEDAHAEESAVAEERAGVNADGDLAAERNRSGLPPPSRWPWGAALVVIAGIGTAVFLATGTPGDPTPTTDPFTAALPSASARATPVSPAARGTLLMPAAADSHHVYVDGALAGVPPAPIVVGCGPHVVKIDADGREQSVTVPCGASVRVAYP